MLSNCLKKIGFFSEHNAVFVQHENDSYRNELSVVAWFWT
jgi:hypothetical protein